LDGAGFLVVRKAREGERAEARDPSGNAADGQKDKPDEPLAEIADGRIFWPLAGSGV
jgi:hypothetical protein